MDLKIINLGSAPNNKTGTPARLAGEWINENFGVIALALQTLIDTNGPSAKIFRLGELQVYKVRPEDDPDYVIEQQSGDYCIGFAENESGQWEFISANYIAGPITKKASYDI
ncbi:hypothetical protein [Flavobacterium algicola]|uniref:hypothetical protein n=1 Tax=Flavobacterium algicola TaxID=556529 RepID=UPI001EFE00F0|nr:hypothetical protein [Flavobacterium algicola]MCG9792474.1 hypothetical protein [Flavobacterium algicola]